MVDPLAGRLRLRELPLAALDFGTRAIEPDGVVPALHDRQAIRTLAVATAELNSDRTVGAFMAGDAIDRVGLVWVVLVIALGIVEADGPEPVDGNVLHVELVDGRAIVLRRRDIEIDRILVGIATPGRRRSDQVPDGIDIRLGAERLLEVRNGRA